MLAPALPDSGVSDAAASEPLDVLQNAVMVEYMLGSAVEMEVLSGTLFGDTTMPGPPRC